MKGIIYKMIKITYQLPNEESFESNTRRQVSSTKVVEEDANLEMLADIAKMLYDQNFDLDISIKVKVPK